METRYSGDPIRYPRMTTDELRKTFLLSSLFQIDQINMAYFDIDRAIIGSAVPAKKRLHLVSTDELKVRYFTERREIGVINTGGSGKIMADGSVFDISNRDGLYIGLGTKEIVFTSNCEDDPAYYYLLSYPAHKEYPTTHARIADASAVPLGSDKECNKRTIYKYIHPGGIKSCQLVMGFTDLAEGSVWNTMPAHTHARRTEIYLYFDMSDKQAVFHLMGPTDETRHIVVRNREAVLSPSWSLHSGVGTKRYAFVWGMGGENQVFEDMDQIAMDQLR